MEYCGYWKLDILMLPENDSDPVQIQFETHNSSSVKMDIIYNIYNQCTSIVKEQYPGHTVKCFFTNTGKAFAIITDNDLNATEIYSNICVSPKDISKYFPEITELELRDDPISWAERPVKFIEAYNDPNSYINFNNLESVMFEYRPSEQVIDELLQLNEEMVIEFYYPDKSLT